MPHWKTQSNVSSLCLNGCHFPGSIDKKHHQFGLWVALPAPGDRRGRNKIAVNKKKTIFSFPSLENSYFVAEKDKKNQTRIKELPYFLDDITIIKVHENQRELRTYKWETWLIEFFFENFASKTEKKNCFHV